MFELFYVKKIIDFVNIQTFLKHDMLITYKLLYLVQKFGKLKLKNK